MNEHAPTSSAGPAMDGTEDTAGGPAAVDLVTTGTIRLTEGVLWEVLDGEAVLYHPGNGSLHLLDPVAAAVWGELDPLQGTALDALTERLASRFSTDPALVRPDVVTFLTSLLAAGVLEVTPAG